ncbi:hypothetical protein VIBC2010_13306 [Vibrio caribbeanicus ATCC BAA-2122]|uniref:Uncharacterized protein n=1 Tax=Vibrio caribbeanicus ATCC BAA-2122 TaxID=796620 RepID=E3BH75_9VIBR|nr:hypothetical protein VIBC2010_13306 [Vibrio caribbeanicus ATCC BAA-2122]
MGSLSKAKSVLTLIKLALDSNLMISELQQHKTGLLRLSK